MSAQTDLIRRLYVAISDGITPEQLTTYFHPDSEQVEYPSLLRPAGHTRPLAEIQEGARLGATMIDEQHYDVHRMIEDGDQVAVQLTWTATLATTIGAMSSGSRLVSHVGAFYDFRDGLILRQSSYDCYEPLPVAQNP